MSERLSRLYPALAERNYRYYWFGQCVSLVGTWMQTTAQQWLVYSLTKSALLLGLLGAAQFGPVMCLSLVAGVVIDRYPKKRLLLITQTCLMLQAFALALLVWTGEVTYWHVLILAALLGLVNTLDQPARQAFVPELVGRDKLRSAIGLNSAIFNLARMIGPALSAVLMARYGAGLLFFVNGLSFIAVIFGISLIRPRPVVVNRARQKIAAEIGEGLRYVGRTPALRNSVLCMLAVGTFIMNFSVITPLYADEVLGAGVHGYGLLLSANGAGALVAALLAASWAKGAPRLRQLFVLGLVLAALLVTLEPVRDLQAAVLIYVLIGFVNILFNNAANATVQFNASDRFRGRVMSVYSLAFLGTTPIGNLFAGTAMEKLGAGNGIALCGAAAATLIVLIAAAAALKGRAGRPGGGNG